MFSCIRIISNYTLYVDLTVYYLPVDRWNVWWLRMSMATKQGTIAVRQNRCRRYFLFCQSIQSNHPCSNQNAGLQEPMPLTSKILQIIIQRKYYRTSLAKRARSSISPSKAVFGAVLNLFSRTIWMVSSVKQFYTADLVIGRLLKVHLKKTWKAMWSLGFQSMLERTIMSQRIFPNPKCECASYKWIMATLPKQP